MRRNLDPDDAIRNRYAEEGVEDYYKENGADYTNPHFRQVRQLLLQNEHRIQFDNVLDFCCGSGEVSQVILELSYPLPLASDPFTAEAYQKQFNRDCLPYSFEDVIKGKMNGHFSAIICSFAMHLCPVKDLFPLAYQLFQCTDQLVIITPHKRPDLEQYDGISLEFEDDTLTERGKKVRLRAYRSTF